MLRSNAPWRDLSERCAPHRRRYHGRNLIERLFLELKHFRPVATR